MISLLINELGEVQRLSASDNFFVTFFLLSVATIRLRVTLSHFSLLSGPEGLTFVWFLACSVAGMSHSSGDRVPAFRLRSPMWSLGC